VSKPALLLYERRKIMFWNKKKPKSKPQIKTTVPKTFKAKEPPPKWQPTFGETKKKGEKPPEVTTKSEPKIDWEDKFLKSFQKLTYRRRAWDVWRDYILLHACSISNVLDKDNYDQREKLYLKIIHQYSKEEQAIFPELAAYTPMYFSDVWSTRRMLRQINKLFGKGDDE